MTTGFDLPRWPVLCLLALFLDLAPTAQAGEQEATSRPATTEPVDVCPCFDPTELTELPGERWDLCLDSKTTIQVAHWYGKRTAEGQQGFNVVATTPSARTMGGSCLLLERFRVGGVLQQAHSQFVDLDRETATACHQMLSAWLASRGGCETEVAEDPA